MKEMTCTLTVRNISYVYQSAPPAENFAPLQSIKFLLSPKNKTKTKKVATFFGFSYWLFAPIRGFWRPGAFCTPNIFSPPPNVNLADSRTI